MRPTFTINQTYMLTIEPFKTFEIEVTVRPHLNNHSDAMVMGPEVLMLMRDIATLIEQAEIESTP